MHPQTVTEQVNSKSSETGRDAAPVRICVIDLGTNSFHALIVDANVNGSFVLLDRIKELVQLGEGGLSRHHLSDQATTRAMEALRRIQLLAIGWGVEDYLAFATSAIREAANGGKFIDRVQSELGIRIRTISGEMEAKLIFEGVRLAVEMRDPTLVVDIGGGSAELMVGTNEEMQFGMSRKIGSARMTAEYAGDDPLPKSDQKRLRKHYRKELAKLLEVARNAGVTELVGCSGAFENLAQVHLNRLGELRRTIYQYEFSASELRGVLKDVIRSSRRERIDMPGIDERRVDQVAAAAVLIDLLVRELDISTIRISPNALREGMVDYFIKQNYERLEQLAPFNDVRRRSIFELGIRCNWEERHCYHVASLALKLFDACERLHRLDAGDRELLEYAGLLHDIGYHINRKNHHKHSHYLIQNAELRGFLPDEIDIMSTAVRYHAGSVPKVRHGLLEDMEPSAARRALKLGAILRLAEGLDRSHFQNVRALEARLTKNKLKLRLSTESDPELDVWGSLRGADLFKKVYGVEVVVDAVAE
jgi:exopolyphosphatase/guanosine-5'-triphosphate,3'-diphosphate pyrophosphatase